MIKLFADTAAVAEIDDCFARGIDDGITTNPGIMKAAGVTDFSEACRGLVARYPNVPISLETDLDFIPVTHLEARTEDVRRTLLKQAERIADYGRNTVVKIPICRGGLEAVAELNSRGIRTNVTACMNPYQALEAAEAGATYVSLFARRMLDTTAFTLAGHNLHDIGKAGVDWKTLAKEANAQHEEAAWDIVNTQIGYVARRLRDDFVGTELIVGSIRKPSDVERVALAEPHIITIPYGIATQLNNIPGLKGSTLSIPIRRVRYGDPTLSHPTTLVTLKEFEDAADASYRKPKQ